MNIETAYRLAYNHAKMFPAESWDLKTWRAAGDELAKIVCENEESKLLRELLVANLNAHEGDEKIFPALLTNDEHLTLCESRAGAGELLCLRPNEKTLLQVYRNGGGE